MPPAPAIQFIAATSNLINQLGDRLPKPFVLSTQHSGAESCHLLDTITDALWKQGKVLVQGNHRLTLWDGTATHSIQFESVQPGFKEDITDKAFRSVMGPVPKLRRLVPALHFTQARYRGAMLDENKKTCVRFEAWEIHCEQGGGAIVQLVPLRGYQPELALLSAALQELGASSDVGVTDLFTRLGYQGHGYMSNPPITLRPNTPVIAATTAMIRTNVAIARQNEQGVIDDLDTEFLHDYRVSLRRVRSIISLFKGAYRNDTQLAFKQEFSELMRCTNRLRDLDVYLLDQKSYYPLLPKLMHEGLEQIFSAFQQERDDEWRELARRFKSKSYRKAMGSLERRFSLDGDIPPGSRSDRPVLQYASNLIAKRYRKVCEIALSIDDATPDHIVHELRLQCKKLRYLLDFFSSLFDAKNIKRLITALKQLQDNLGRFNDYSVQQQSLQAFLDQKLQGGARIDHRMIEAVGALVAIKHQLQLKERAQVMEKFAGFHSEETEQLFASMFGIAGKKKPQVSPQHEGLSG